MAIRGAQTLVARVLGNVEFAPLNQNSRFRKRRLQYPRRPPTHHTAAMIEMQMRQHNLCNIASLHACAAESVQKPSVTVIEDLALDRAQTIADARVHQDGLAAVDD